MSAREMDGPEPLSIAEYERLPDDPSYRDELVRGFVVREPRPKDDHGWLVMKLGHRLVEAAERSGAGYVVTESGFVLQDAPPTVRGPDLAFIARARVPRFPVGSYHRFGPDLAVEVLSTWDRPSSVRQKVHEYFAAGSRLVWLVDPRAHTVTVHHSPTSCRVLHHGDELTGEEVLPGFSLALERLFAAPD